MPEEGTSTPEKKSHTGLIIGIVLIVIVVLLALFFGLYFGLRNKGDDIPDEVNPDPDIVEPGPEEDPDGDDDGDGEPEHTHTYGEWQYDDTYHWKECSECGDIIDKEEHTLEYINDEVTNKHYQECSICGYTSEEEDHIWVETSNEPATCTEDGETDYKCELCEATKTEAIEPLGHNPSSDWSSDANGHWHECLNGCGEKLDYADHTTMYKDNGDGTHTEYCSVCNYEIKTESHEIEYTKISGNDTYHTESCKYCDYTATVAHTFDGYISDGENGHHQVCSECEYITTIVSHNLGSYISDGESGHYKECSECTYKTDSSGHDYEATNIYNINLIDVATGEATATYEYTCSVCEHVKEVSDVPYTLNFTTDPWNVIDQVSSAGYASTYYSVGDTKTIVIDDEEHEIRIDDFDHDELTITDGDYNDNVHAAITCEMVDCLSTAHAMNSSKTNSGGWDQCKMRSYLNTDKGCVLSTLDEDLQAVIKKVDKKSTAGGSTTSLGTTASDSLFLLAKVEVDGTTDSGYVDEGTQYAYWNEHPSGTDHTKYQSGSAVAWWLRSPLIDGYNRFHAVDKDSREEISNFLADSAYGVSFAFCI